jgi:hypothetical protein
MIFTITLYSQEVGVFKDTRDGQIYKIIKIKNQIWMAENLRYNEKGTMYYKNDSIINKNDGRFYTFNQANKTCPIGWHLPSVEEAVIFNQNIFVLALTKSGFIDYKNKSKKKGNIGYYWTSLSKGVDKAYCYMIAKQGIKQVAGWKDYKYSVRCVADKSNIELYDNASQNPNKYANKTKAELNKLLKETLAKENYDEAVLIKEAISIKTIREKYATKTNKELKTLLDMAVSVEDYEKAEEIQSVIDKRKNLSPELTKVELQMLLKDALVVEDYERAEKIKRMLEKKTISENLKNNNSKNIELPKYVGKNMQNLNYTTFQA